MVAEGVGYGLRTDNNITKDGPAADRRGVVHRQRGVVLGFHGGLGQKTSRKFDALSATPGQPELGLHNAKLSTGCLKKAQTLENHIKNSRCRQWFIFFSDR